MNLISCMIRILEIPQITLMQHQIPLATLRIEMVQDGIRHNPTIVVEAKVWGNLAYDIEKYYAINDYALVEGYFSTNYPNQSKEKSVVKKKPTLTIFQIYPFLFPLL